MAFIYENPERVMNLRYSHQVGFNAGDRMRGVNLVGFQPKDKETTRNLELHRVNIFRIDGEYRNN